MLKKKKFHCALILFALFQCIFGIVIEVPGVSVNKNNNESSGSKVILNKNTDNDNMIQGIVISSITEEGILIFFIIK